MANIVLGLGTSHSPQLSVHWSQWKLFWEKDETDPRLDYPALVKRARSDIADDLTPKVWEQRYNACTQAIETLGQQLQAASPDVVVVLGDDQHEQFLDDNLPMLSLYHGKTVPLVDHEDGRGPAWKVAEEQGFARTADEYPAAWQLAEHLLEALTLEEFDLARTNQLRKDRGVGHAFSFLYRRIWPGGTVPMVPFMVNTYYPPNQPTPRRCYRLGQALRKGIEAWDNNARVAIMASGGLSHTIIDEELDRKTLEGLQEKDAACLWSLPREKFSGGTSEILNWIALAGAMEKEDMTLVDYVPTYRSPAGTGCGMAFAYWK